MKIFLSYGHDSSAEELVNRIKRDLVQLGHDVWLDKERIDFGDDWRREITDGIVESDQVLAFLSQHSTRDPGVCRDEITIALGAGKAYVFTILVQPEQDVDLPLSVSHLQWLDMHDWQERQQDPEQFELWYADCLARIIEVIEHPDNQRFAGEISQLEQYLKPLDCSADIFSRVQKFTGRQWLVDELNQWREGDRHSRVFWLSGAPGIGKSAIAAWLAHSGKSHVIATQFCRYNSPERREPTRVIRSIAFQLATRLQDYRRHLMYQPEIADLDRKNPAELFDYLLANPLRYAIDGNRTRHLIILDALDESMHAGKSELTELIAAEIHKLPDWIGWVVTSRPEAAIRRQLDQFGVHELNADDLRNQQDIATYINEWLIRRGLVEDRLNETRSRIIQAAQGNFLYLRQLELAVEQNIINLNQLDDLPKGLSALYSREFGYRFPDLAAYEKDILPLLEILVASSRPIPAADIEIILKWSKRQRIRVIEQLGSFVNNTQYGIELFHKSLKDWLIDEECAGADYFVEVENGHQVLGKVLWEQFTQEEDLISHLDSFMALEMPEQLMHWKDRDLLILIGEDVPNKYLNKIKALINLRTLNVNQHWQQDVWGWFAIRISELYLGKDHIQSAEILSNVAGFLEHIANYDVAESLYWQVLKIREQVAGADYPDTTETLDNLAWLKENGHHTSEAEWLFCRALAIRLQMLDANHPDIARSLNNLGLLLAKRGKYVAAEQLLRRAFSINEQTLGADHLNIADSSKNLAMLLRKKGDYTSAEQLLRRALSITERVLGSDHPDTAISLDDLARLLSDQGDYASAELLYHKALEIRQRSLGPYHSYTVETTISLAKSLKYQGKYESANQLFCQIIAIIKTKPGLNCVNSLDLININLAIENIVDYDSAEPLHHQFLQMSQNVFGSDSLATAMVLNSCSNLFRKEANAETLFRQVLAINEQAFGPEHHQTLFSLKNLAFLLTENNYYLLAKKLYDSALIKIEKSFGAEHINVVPCLNDFALFLKINGDHISAEQLYRRALLIIEKSQGVDHLDTAKALNNIAGLLIKYQGNYHAAEPLYRRALIITEKGLGIHPDTVIILKKLALILRKKCDYVSAEQLLRQALSMTEQVLGPDHLNTAIILDNLVDLFLYKNNYTEAEKLCCHVLAIREKELGRDHSDTHKSMHRLGVIIREVGRYDEAEVILHEVIELRTRLFGAKSLEVAESLSALGLTLSENKLYKEAYTVYQKALEIRIKNLGEDHLDTKLIDKRIANLEAKRGLL